MNKLKLILFAAVLFFTIRWAQAAYQPELLPTPDGTASQPAAIEYGGVDYSTSAFSINHTTASISGAKVYGVIFSTGQIWATDFVDVWDATSAVNTTGLIPMRFYNNRALFDVTGSTIASGFSGLAYPAKFRRGIIWRASSSLYNSIQLLFFKD